MPAETMLPKNHKEYKTLDMTRESPTHLMMNILMAVLFLAFFYLLSGYAVNIRPEFGGAQFGGLWGWSTLLIFVLAYLMMYAHEALHWLGFKLFSGANPQFLVKGITPRAIMEEVYMPKGTFIASKAMPAVVLTIVYLILVFIVPTGWLVMMLYFFAGNLAYAASDLLAITEAVRGPKGTLIEDVSDEIYFYADKEFSKK